MEDKAARRTITTTQLRRLVYEIDEEMHRDGVPVEDRSLRLADRLCARLGTPWFWGTPVQSAAQSFLLDLYPPNVLGMPPLYVGAFLFKGVIYKLAMNCMLGLVTIDFDKMIVDMPSERVRQMRADPAAYGAYIDQCCDVVDIALGFGDLRRRPLSGLEAMARLNAGVSQLQQAAAGAVAIPAPKDGVMHSLFLSAEILIKGALIASGCSDEQMRRRGHKLEALLADFTKVYPASDEKALGRALTFLPKSVDERYEHINYSPERVGFAVMASQFIAGEVVRAVTARNLRVKLKRDGASCSLPRTFP